MKRTALALTLILALLLSAIVGTQLIKKARAGTIIVPDDYATIQEAINAANTGDTILVGNDTYYENVILNKTVSLVGENPQNTIISGNTSVTLNITANSVTVTGFTITGASTAGVEVTSNYTSITGNTITNNSWGLRVHENYNNITQNNIVNNSGCGIGLKNASFTGITGNAISGSKGAGIDIRYSSNNILRGNDVNVPSSLFVILLVGSPHNIIAGNNLIGGTNDLIIQCGDGSDYNEISENNITGTGGYAFSGIALFTASNCNISRNNITNCWEGIGLLNSLNNTISGNYITANQMGIRLIEALNNTISENNITANTVYGIGSDNVQGSNNNTIFHNNFVGNAQQANSAGGNNTWDNGYPSGGNYWSDYKGIDADGDGIGDTPYVIDANNTDRYPLMFPYGTSPSPTPTPTPTPSPTPQPTATPAPTPSPTASPYPEPIATPTPSPSPEPTITPEPQLEPFPTTLVIASIASVAVVSVGLRVYFKKRNNKQK